MPKQSELLGASDKREITRRRGQARLWARRFLKERPTKEDSELIAAAQSDPDNPSLTDRQLRRMRAGHLISPELVVRQLRRERSRPKSEKTKQQVTLRIDRDVLEKFRATGQGWQRRMNDALRKAAKV